MQNEQNPKVSVIIPVYNVEPFLRECLDSIANQTLRNIEIICVNDGSTDNSLKILEEYRANDPRFTVISQDNKGLSAARNKGMQHASGEYLYFIDSDDYLDLDALKTVAQLADETDLDVVLFERSPFYDPEELKRTNLVSISPVTETSFYCSGLDYMKDAKENGTYSSIAVRAIYRRKLLQENHIHFKEGIIHEDNLFSFQVFMSAGKVLQIPDPFYHRRVRADSIMTKPVTFRNVAGYFYCAEDILRYALQGEYSNEKEHEIWRAYLEMARTTNWTYQALSLEEQKRNSFPREIENELFNQILASSQADDLRRTAKRLQYDLDCVHASASYRLGRAMTWLPRKIRGGIRCYQEHGLRYTGERLLVHLHLKVDPDKVFDYAYCCALSPEQYPEALKLWYKRSMGYELDLDNPKTYNEKIQWLKLYDSTPLKTRLADKYLVRDWVKEKIGEEPLIPLLGVWDSFDEIDFDKLPNQFVLKANHGSGWNIIVKDKAKFDREDAKRKFDSWMRTNFAFLCGFELQYLNISPKIIAEEYLENGNNDLFDYKVFCFDGRAESVMFLSERKQGLKMAFYDLNWNKLPFVYSYPQNEKPIPKPEKLELLIELAEKLAAGFAHVRVDFYVLNDGSIKFGEMTFSSASGICEWNIPEPNVHYGNLITLPPKSPIPTRI